MINNFKSFANYILVGMLAILVCFSCEDEGAVEAFDEFLPDSVVSLAKPDSVQVVSGYEKLKFVVYINAQPTIKKVVISTFDDNINDDDDKEIATIDINRTVFQSESYEVTVELPEGQNEYFIHIEDAQGNKSIVLDTFGTVLGDEFIDSLLIRPYLSFQAYSDTEVIIYWDVIEEEDANSILSTEIRYTDSNGTEQMITVANEDTFTIIPDIVSEGLFYIKSTHVLSEEPLETIDSLESEETFPAI